MLFAPLNIFRFLSLLWKRSEPIYEKHLLEETIERLQSDLDTIQVLLNEVKTDLNNELGKVSEPVKLEPIVVEEKSNKPSKLLGFIALAKYFPFPDEPKPSSRYTGFKKYTMQRKVQKAVVGKLVPLSANKEVLTTAQLSKRWKVSQDTVSNWCMTGRVKCYKAGLSGRGFWLINGDFIRSFEAKLHKHPVPSTVNVPLPDKWRNRWKELV